MNSVVMNREKSAMKWTVPELTRDNFSADRSAFLGTAGYGKYGLYLITHTGLVKADNPYTTFSHPRCRVSVDRFVDVIITVKERDKE